ncbi:hypothetical protein [Streptomyces sp. NPDC001070]
MLKHCAVAVSSGLLLLGNATQSLAADPADSPDSGPRVAAGVPATEGPGTEPGSGAIEPGGEAVPAPGAGTVLDDGSVVGAADERTFAIESDKPAKEGGGSTPSACPEVNDRPTYKVTGRPYFMPDRGHPQSTWLPARQTVGWTITGSHTSTWDIGVGYEAEASIIVDKAKVEVDTKISNSWTWTGTQTVTDTNTTGKGYRAVLGQAGWNLTAVKPWVAPPCNLRTKTIVISTPRKGDISIGRVAS